MSASARPPLPTRSPAELKAAYAAGHIGKAEYIRQRFAWHRRLFDYVTELAQSELHEIRITADGVHFRLGEEDLTLCCPPDEPRVAPIEAINFGAYEGRETAILNALAADATQVLDIGANIGVYTIRLALRFPHLRLFAFEPIPVSFDYLQRNIALNAVGDRVRAFQYALADVSGATTLYIAPENGTNASLKNVADAADARQVPGLTLTLDEWQRAFGIAPDLIKCDVEGGELGVFRGGRRTLAAHRPMVFTELLRKWAKGFGYHPNDVLSLFRGLGYRSFAIAATGVREILLVDEETPETNYVFAHPERHPQAVRLLTDGAI